MKHNFMSKLLNGRLIRAECKHLKLKKNALNCNIRFFILHTCVEIDSVSHPGLIIEDRSRDPRIYQNYSKTLTYRNLFGLFTFEQQCSGNSFLKFDWSFRHTQVNPNRYGDHRPIKSQETVPSTLPFECKQPKSF